MRNIAVGIEAFRADRDEYPEGTDSVLGHDPALTTFLGALDTGYYTFRVRNGDNSFAGRDFAVLTTPIAYLNALAVDPFAGNDFPLLTYAYRNAKVTKNGWIMTSFGPDRDLFANVNGKIGAGTVNPNLLGTAADAKVPARLGDINEAGVTSVIEKTSSAAVNAAVESAKGLRPMLDDLAYDPTNGTLSDGDIYRLGP